jgi:hypothetical protein
MAAVALQRELDAYSDAIGKYNQQARRYTSAATKHNEAVDAYRDAVLTYKSGVDGVRASAIGQPKVFYAEYSLGGTRIDYYTDFNTQMSISKPPAGYVAVKDPSGFFIMQKADAVKPGEFTMKEPTSPGKAPSATAGQMKRLDAPSLTDIERTGGSGLISSAFNF